MKMNVEKLNIDDIYKLIKSNIDKMYNSFLGNFFTKEEFKRVVLEEIDKSRKNYDKDIDYIKYIEDKINTSIGDILRIEFDKYNRQKDIINKFFINTDNYDDSINSLKKLDSFLNMYNLEINPSCIFELINSDSLFCDNIRLVVKKYNKEISLGNLDMVFDSYRIIFIIESYCEIKNITVTENYEINSSDYINDSVRAYLVEIGKIPLLTLPEEKELGKRLLNGDDNAKLKLIESNLKLVVSIARKYVGRGLDFLDLIQEGNIGLSTAASRYDVNKGYKFSTYATWWIRQSITRAIEEKGRIIRIPIHVHDKINKYNNVVLLLETKLNRMPTLDEISSQMGMSKEELTNMLKASSDVVSMNLLVGDDEESELGDFIADYEDSPERTVSRDILKENVWKLINNSNLTELEKEVLISRFNLDGNGVKTLTEIGRKHNVTRERIRQIEARVLRKLRRSKDVINFSLYMDQPDRAVKVINDIRKNDRRINSKRKTIYEYFNNYDKEKIDNVLSLLDSEERRLINLKFGNGGFLNKKNAIIIDSEIIPKIRMLLESKGEVRKMKKVKTIYEYLSDYSRDAIDLVIENLREEEKQLIVKRYGYDLDNPITSRFSKEDNNNFYGSLIPKMKRLLKKNDNIKEEKEEQKIVPETEIKQEVVLDKETIVSKKEKEKVLNDKNTKEVIEVSDDYETIFNVLRLPRFNEIMNCFSAKETIVILLKLGYVDGKYYSNDTISNFLGISKEEIIEVTKMALKLYKVNLNLLLDDLIVSTENAKKLKNS